MAAAKIPAAKGRFAPKATVTGKGKVKITARKGAKGGKSGGGGGKSDG